MSVLAAQGIRKSFGHRRVLTGVDLAVEPGEMAAVVGENGSDSVGGDAQLAVWA